MNTEIECGIDISKYQNLRGTVDFSKVKMDGYSFVMLRAVSSNNSGVYIDPYFNVSYHAAKEAGLKVGAYLFTYAEDYTYLYQELDMLFKAIDGKQFEYPIAFDIEVKGIASLGRIKCTDIAMEGLKKIQEHGYYAQLYTYYAYQKNYLDMSRLSVYDLWIADYRGYCGYSGSYGIWQYTSQKTVGGITGNCDANISYKDYSSIIKNAKLNGYGETVFSPYKATAQYNLNIRENNNSGSKIDGIIKSESIITVEEESNGYAKISGWVSKKYLE